MSQRLKRWESPRREGRNDKGRGGSARARQLKKQTQMLRQKLKEGGERSPKHKNNTKNGKNQGEETLILPPDFFFAVFTVNELMHSGLQYCSKTSFNQKLRLWLIN